MILELILGCARKVSVGRIQTGYMDSPPPAGLWKAALRVLVGWSGLFASIDNFSWSKISFKLFVQALFCWFLTSVYHIYWIHINWSWNLSLVVLENCQWSVSKTDTQIYYPHRSVEGRDEGDGFCDFTSHHQISN